MRPFHARGPDNQKSGVNLSLQPMLLSHSCIHDVLLHDTCAKCSEGPSSTLSFDFLPENLEQHVLKAIEGRKVDRAAAAAIRKSMLNYYNESLAPAGDDWLYCRSKSR